MNDYEKINARVQAKTAGKKKWLGGRIAWIAGVALAAGLGLWGLKAIGFISRLFFVILLSGDALVCAFKVGCVWSETRF